MKSMDSFPSKFEQTRKVFTRPLEPDIVMAQYKEPLDLGKDFFQLYSEMITDGLEYQVCEKRSEVNPKIIFNLLDASSLNINSLSYVREKTDPSEWNMHHRLITTKDIGITGTDFLEKSESYMKILREHNKIKIDKFIARASQPSVIAWLEKNKFKIKDKDTSEFSKALVLYNGIYVAGEGYELVPSFEEENKISRDPYLIRTDLFKSQESLEKLKDFLSTKEGKHSFTFKDADQERDTMIKIFTDGYIPRFHLEKEISD